MGMLGKLARGLATGAANYYGIVAQQQLEERKAAIAFDREKAMEAFRSQNRREETAAAAAAQAGLEGVKTDERIREVKETLGPKAEAEIRVSEAEESARLRRELTTLGVKFKQDWSLTQLREAAETGRTRIREGGQNARQEDQQEHELNTKPILNVENAAGEPTAVFAPGADVRTVTARGGRNKPSGVQGGYSWDAGSRAAPAAAARPAAPAGPDYSTFNQLLSEAAMDPRFKGRSADEIRREVRGLAMRNNIPVPPQ